MRARSSDLRGTLTRRVLRCDVIDMVTWGNCWLLWSVSYFTHTKIISGICLALLLVRPHWRRAPQYWWGVVLAWLPQLVWNWQQNEDHVYFVFYWFAATSLALWGGQPRAVLASNARWLIALCFLIAAGWKSCSPEFCRGQVLAYKMIEDYRFRELVTTPWAGWTASAATRLDQELGSLRAHQGNEFQLNVPLPERVVTASWLMTWWTVFIEWSIGLLFLMPSRWASATCRHAALLVFVATTYAVVPVMGFANAFLLMGLAQTTRGQLALRGTYLGIGISLVLWTLCRTTLL